MNVGAFKTETNTIALHCKHYDRYTSNGGCANSGRVIHKQVNN